MPNNNTKYFVSYLILLFLTSCVKGQQKKHEDRLIQLPNIRDSITIYGDTIKIFDDDSVVGFYKNGRIQFVRYLSENSLCQIKQFNENGHIIRIEFNPNHPQLSSLYEEYYAPEGNVSNRELWVDSLVKMNGISYRCNILKERYFRNGKMKSAGFYGTPFGQNAPVGLHKYFDELGSLRKTENFIYPANKQPYIIISEYYENEKPKWEKIYVNHLIHDSDQEEPIGLWKFYDASGKIIGTEQYSENK